MDTIKYFGHSSFAINLDGTVCLINPVLGEKIHGEKRVAPNAFSMVEARKCDLIFANSEQPESCEPSTIKDIVERTYASVVAPKTVLSKINFAEKFKVDVKAGDRFSMKGLDIEVVKAVYPQAQYPVGFVIRGKNYSVYHAGETYQFVQMGQIRCDLAVLPIGGTYTMDGFAAANACKEIRPKYAIPMCFGSIPKLEADVEEFLGGLPPEVKPIVLKPGQAARMP